MRSINCTFNDQGAWCHCKKVKRALLGIGARCCIEYPPMNGVKCEHKVEFVRPIELPPPPRTREHA